MAPPSKPSSKKPSGKAGTKPISARPPVKAAGVAKPKPVASPPPALKVTRAPMAETPRAKPRSDVSRGTESGAGKVDIALPPVQPEPDVAAIAPNAAPVASAPVIARTAAEAIKKAEVEKTAPQPTQPNDIATSESAPSPGTAEGKTMMTEAMETGKNFAADAKEKFQAACADFSGKAKSAVEKSGKLAEELGDITRGNIEAMVESSKIAAKGVETMNQDTAEFGRRQFERTSAAIKSFAAAKTPAEFFQLQSDLLASSFDTLATESAKRSEAMLKLAGDIAQPISTRFSVVSEKVKSLAA